MKGTGLTSFGYGIAVRSSPPISLLKTRFCLRRRCVKKPDLIWISLGCDAHRKDPMAGGGLTSFGYGKAVQIISTRYGKKAKTVIASEGGYHPCANYGRFFGQ